MSEQAKYCTDCRKLKRANRIAVEALTRLSDLGSELAKLALIKMEIATKGKK